MAGVLFDLTGSYTAGFQILEYFRVIRGQVGRFAGIAGHVVELPDPLSECETLLAYQHRLVFATLTLPGVLDDRIFLYSNTPRCAKLPDGRKRCRF
jgi:hypothetical protein